MLSALWVAPAFVSYSTGPALLFFSPWRSRSTPWWFDGGWRMLPPEVR